MYVCRYVGLSTGNPYKKIRIPKCVGGITWPKHAHAQSQFWAVKNQPMYDTRTLYARAALAWTKNIEIKNLKRTELQRLNNRGKKG